MKQLGRWPWASNYDFFWIGERKIHALGLSLTLYVDALGGHIREVTLEGHWRGCCVVRGCGWADTAIRPVIGRSLVLFPSPHCYTSKYPRFLTEDAEPSNCSRWAGRHLARQPPPSVYDCVGGWAIWRVWLEKRYRNVNLLDLLEVKLGWYPSG